MACSTSWFVRLSVVLMLGLGACRGPQLGAASGEFPLPLVGDLLMATFQGQNSVLDGLDPFDPAASWGKGDRVLYGIRLDDPDEGLREWLLLLTVRSGVLEADSGVLLPEDEPNYSGPRKIVSQSIDMSGRFSGRSVDPGNQDVEFKLHSDSILVSVDVIEKGGQISRDFAFAPEAFLRKGFFSASKSFTKSGDMAAESWKTNPREFIQKLFNATASLLTFFQIAQKAPSLRPILEGIVDMPSVVSVLLNLGVEISVSPHLDQSQLELRRFEPWQSLDEVYRFPTEIFVNGSVAGRFHLFVGPPDSPLTLGSGLLAVAGTRPDDPQKRFAIRLLAARRGSMVTTP